MDETAFIDSLRALAGHPATRGLLDDAAVLDIGGKAIVLTHDMIVENVHFLPSDLPADIAWKLVAVNLSDLAAKGARPIGLLLGYSLSGDEWDQNFLHGLRDATERFGAPLIGGDTVAPPMGTPRSFGLTAIGEAGAVPVPSRAGARRGDLLWVSGTIGDAGAGLRLARDDANGPAALLESYRRPEPRLEAGQALAPLVDAMMDISDGLLIDAARMAHASGVAVEIDLARIPLSEAYVGMNGGTREARLVAAVAGDDYELLFAAPAAASNRVAALARTLALPLTHVGRVREGTGLALVDDGEPVPPPGRLGFEHVPK